MPLKIAIVGTGKVAAANYVPYLAGREDVALGYFTRTPSKAHALAAAFGGEVFDTLDALAAWSPDSIFVLTHETQRHAVSNALLDRKPKRLFWEKPLVARAGQAAVDEQDYADAKALMARAWMLGTETAMIFNYRFLDHSILAAQIVDERGFGQVLNVAGTVHFACWSHCIDLIHFFAGPIVLVSALEGNEVDLGDSPVSGRDLMATLRTTNGGSGILLGTSAMHWAFPLYELTFHFEHGRIKLRGLDGDLEVMDARTQRSERFSVPLDRSRWDQYNRSFDKSIAAYLDSLHTGTPPPVPGLAGLRELQVEAGFRRSIALGRPVDLADELPLEA
jgi:predicted dehydrogenase